MTKLEKLRVDTQNLADPVRAQHSSSYFKTAPGQYGHGDVFIGLIVPQCHALAKKYSDLSLVDIKTLLHSPIHEHRQIALMILNLQFSIANAVVRKSIITFYLNNLKYVNNWDLVDGSAEMLGDFYLPHNLQPLISLAKSVNIWERRIAIVSTFSSSKRGDPLPTTTISSLLLRDPEDLIHKAVGWMLREVGKHSGQKVLEEFLKEYYHVMPRTMLRYSIERFPETLRRRFIEGKV